MGNTYARLWAVVPEEKRYFADPPFIKQFYSLVGDFVLGFAKEFFGEAVLKFSFPIQWNTLVYEDDLLNFKYRSYWEFTTEYGYHKQQVTQGACNPCTPESTSEVIVSDETYSDGTPHLLFRIDEEDRRMFTVWNMRQLAHIIRMTEKTWDIEIASVLFFQPDPISHMFGNKNNVQSSRHQQMLETVSKILQEMEHGSLPENRPYQRLYMLLQQFDLFYLYRRMFMNYEDKTYLDPNLPYREVNMLHEMAEYGGDAPLNGIVFLKGISDWGWSAPLYRHLYGDVAYVVVTTHDNVEHCLTINVTGIYENGLLQNQEDYGTPPDTSISTLVMWLKLHDKYFHHHFVRASYRYDTRQEIIRAGETRRKIDALNVAIQPRKFIAMDENRRIFLMNHLERNPVIRKKSGYWLNLRHIHKNQYSANKTMYGTMANQSHLFPQKKPPNERKEEEDRVNFLTKPALGIDNVGLEELRPPGLLQSKNDQDDFYPEHFPYEPNNKLRNGQVPETADINNPLYWPIFRIHRLLRWGCPASICAGALMINGEEFFKESNAAVYHEYPIVEAALNMCEVCSKEYGLAKFELLEMLTRFAQCKFTLRQVNFFDGIRAIYKALRSRFLEVKTAAAVCLATLQEAQPENQKVVGRDGGIALLLQVMECPKVTADTYWFYNYYKKHKRKWPEEALAVAAAQAASAVWLALRDRRNRYEFMKLKGVPVCVYLLRNGAAPDYATIPVIGILCELAHENQFHHQIVASGALKVVCKVLRQTKNEDVFQNSAELVKLLCDRDEARTAIKAAGGLAELLKPLKTSTFWTNQGCMQAVTEAVYKSAISIANCEVFHSANALDLVLDRLNEGVGETVASNILAFIGEMVRVEASRFYIRGGGILPFIMDFMNHSNQFVRMKAAVATGRMGVDKDSYSIIVENNGIITIWHLMSKAYAPIVNVHGCMAIYPLFVANPKETSRIIKTIVNPFYQVFALLDLDDPKVTDAVLNLICLLSQDNDLLAIMSDIGFCTFISRHIDTQDVRLLRFVTEAVARGSEYAVNRINFSPTGVVPRIAKLLWHPDEEIQTNALAAVHELTKYPQNIIQIHSDRLVRRLLSYLMEGSDVKAQQASGCLRHMRFLAMANMSDTYNFENTYFSLVFEDKKAINKTIKELLTKKLMPEAKAESDQMKMMVQNEKRAKMIFMPIPEPPAIPKALDSDREKLPLILRKSPHDQTMDAEVTPQSKPTSDLREIPAVVRQTQWDAPQIREDRTEDDRVLQAAYDQGVRSMILNDPIAAEKEWWTDDFDEENYNLFNRLTIKNNFLEDHVDPTIVVTRPQDFEVMKKK